LSPPYQASSQKLADELKRGKALNRPPHGACLYPYLAIKKINSIYKVNSPQAGNQPAVSYHAIAGKYPLTTT